MSDLVLTFTNLYPSAAMPTHGLFVKERMTRVAAAMPGCDWQVVSPVPAVLWLLRSGHYKRWHAMPDREQVDGVTVHHPRYRHWPGAIARQADAMATAAMAVVAEVVGGRRAVVDAHYLWPDGVAAATIAQKLGLPYTLTARGTDVNVVASDHRIARRIAAAAEGAIGCYAVSTALAERFAAVCSLPRDRVQLARNGVDLVRFHPGDAAVARAELGLPATGRLVLGVGRLVEAKGFHLAVAALDRLPADVRLVLIGDGPDRATLQASGGERLICLGPQPPDRVAMACRACDLLVLPSEREGWPNVVTEALASGLRVVATAVGGIPEILGHPKPDDRTLGALVPAGDGEALAAALQAMLAVPGDRAAVRRFAERYGWEQPVSQLVAVFRRALQGGGRG